MLVAQLAYVLAVQPGSFVQRTLFEPRIQGQNFGGGDEARQRSPVLVIILVIILIIVVVLAVLGRGQLGHGEVLLARRLDGLLQ